METRVEDFNDVLELLATGRYEIRPGNVPEGDGFTRAPSGPPRPPLTEQLLSVQPLEGDEAQQLPEGERVDAWRTVFSAYPLAPADTTTGRLADVVVLPHGEGVALYSVQRAWPWAAAAGVTQALVRRLESSL